METWESQSKKAQEIERKLEHGINQYAEYSTPKNNVVIDSEWNRNITEMEKNIGQMLNELEATVHKLDEFTANGSSSMGIPFRMLQRHTDSYQEYRISFKKYQMNANNVKTRHGLLGKSREYRAGATGEEMLLDERIHIDSSIEQTEFIIGQAYGVRTDLRDQHGSLINSTNRVIDVGNIMPNINVLLRRIRARKLRDQVILGIVISVCLIILIKYIFGI
ncbi:hypothetical protein BB559_001641 [Furculomyces boomerangus]|uniref:Golgi SNAP receptor complex member 1 n=2 Tax=Harpellales TaxID=61421 RepID=A0A2T9Z196_9FUNG|nr:hypothetical protein BB559_001641 [Furculomyces boomerangus]PVZ98886.1 hypothetical protein BB558_005110 [Smittium angustum]